MRILNLALLSCSLLFVHRCPSENDQSLKEAITRSANNTSAASHASGPRYGTYTISTAAKGSQPIITGYFELYNGKYKQYDAGKKLISTGTYRYDEVHRQVLWQSGRLKEYNDRADFEVASQGHTHYIKLRNGTHASNSPDSKIVLPN